MIGVFAFSIINKIIKPSAMENQTVTGFKKRNLRLTLIYAALGCLLMASGMIVGISDNPPGIYLSFAGLTFLILAIVHPWRNIRHYQILLIAGAIGFPFTAILHNAFEAAGQYFLEITLLSGLFNGIGAFFFLVAIFLCPVLIFTGIGGIIYLSIKKKAAKKQVTNHQNEPQQ